MAGEDRLREYLKKATADLTEARRKLAAADEPIAVVGMACRFPGAEGGVDAYWDLLAQGRSGVLDEVPGGRFDLSAGVRDHGVYTTSGAFLRDVAGWDAPFFGSSPGEALRMDPQQRLLMELTWEALEDAGTPPPALAGSRTGVLVGFSDILQYGRVQMETEGPEVVTEPYTGQGASSSVVSGRLAYHFDLRGPSLTVDTACSSSLVAVHLAGGALRRGECDLAVAGGAFLALHPDIYVNACAAAMLSPEGRCKTFDAGADGYVLGEGAGLVVLERLSDAVRRGHRVHAVLRGSAVNQDGRSNGLTAPSRAAQAEVIRAAHAVAGVRPDQIRYLEAHGSGTPLGDAIELGALTDVFGRRTAENPLHVGAVKTNVGHTQAAAGMAGLIKTVLVLKNGTAPRNLHLDEPSETTRGAGEVRPLTAARELPQEADGAPTLAGVSSFGWCGTNAHVVVAAAEPRGSAGTALPAAPAAAAESGPAGASDGPELLPVSAADAGALRERLTGLATAADRPGTALADLAHTLQQGRAALEFRRAVVAGDPAEAAAALTEAAGRPPVRPVPGGPRTGYLLPDRDDAGRTAPAGPLYGTDRAYTEAADACLDALGEDAAAVRAALLDPAAPAGAETADLAHFTAGWALAHALTARGARPALLAGRGLGELTAAALAGVCALPDALALVALRARLRGTGAAEDGRDDARGEHAEAAAAVAALPRSAPGTPLVCGVTGTVLDAEQATDAARWTGLLTAGPAPAAAAGPVPPAADGVDVWAALGAGAPHGPAPEGGGPVVLATPADAEGLLRICGRLWELGAEPRWSEVRAGRRPGRLTSLPAYPFQRTRHWPAAPAAAAPVTAPGTAAEPVAAAAPEPVPATAAPAPGPSSVDGRASAPGPAADDGHVRLLARHWVAEPAPGASVPPPGRQLLLDDGTGVAEELAALLTAAGGRPVLVPAGADVPAELPAELPGDGPVTVVVCTAPGEQDPAAAVWRAASAATERADAPGTTALLLVTRGGQAVGAGAAADPAQAAVAVLPVVLGQEYPGLDVRGVDLDPATEPALAAADLAETLGVTGGPVLTAYRDGLRHVPAYREAPAPAPSGPAVRPGGSYLVTGGLGVIGLVVAEHLVRGGAGRVVLAGRSGLAADATGPRAEAVARLRALGTARVETPRLDVTDPAAVAGLLRSQRFDGVLHAAGDTAEDAFVPLGALEEPLLRRHFGAKYQGARAISAAIAGLPADLAPGWVLLFSSTSAHLGGLAFGSYAAANAALEALARPGAGPAPTRWISAAWDTWTATLARTEERTAAALAAYAMTDAQALAALDAAVTQPLDAVVIAAGGWRDRLPERAEPAPAEPAGPDVAAGPLRPRPELPQPYVSPLTATERELCGLWAETLGVSPVGTRDNFFDLGGSSFSALQMLATVRRRFGRTVQPVALFESPTVRRLAAVLDGADRPADAPAAPAPGPRAADAAAAPSPSPSASRAPSASPSPGGGRAPEAADDDRRIAVVGMAGRFPGAEDVGSFWRNVRSGVESISFFTPEELIEAGVDPELAHDPEYVRARPVLADITGFDAGFFGMSPRAAALADPQQRLFLEVCWEALEHAGCAHESYRDRVGVFGGANLSTYLLGMVPQLGGAVDVSPYELIMSNDKDALTTTVSYLFDLRGPSVAVQTFCSTSLVAVHTAVRSLRAGECEVALAGGVSIGVPDRKGHRRVPGGMDSHDGHVHSFDADATGTMFGDGAAVVVLKRLGDALRDGDTVHAVIRGSALNNDGALKAGYTAPSVSGQAAAVRAALADAGVTPGEIGYVEAHGSATELGDPIEVAALTQAFGSGGEPGSVPIGAVKTNVGHLNHAAGTAGLIKTTCTVRDGLIPASLNYTRPNPQIDFAAGPFFVNTEARAWPAADDRPRIAGVNSLGMGGTNVHVVVEQPPARPEPGPTARRHHVLAVSARTEGAADQAVGNLAGHLAGADAPRVADVAYTLHVGRKTFEHRRAAVVTDTAHAAAVLAGTDDRTAVSSRVETASGRQVALLLAGVGEQYPGLVGDLYRHEPVFRAEFDAVAALLAPLLPETDVTGLLAGERSGGGGMDLAALLGRSAGTDDPRAAQLERTEVVQPLMFAVDYALARTFAAWGVRPSLMLGYSLGEYAAACLAGVLTLQDAVALVAHRARLIAGLEGGGMVAVPLGAEELRGRYRLDNRGLDIAAVNGPAAVVVAGPQPALAELTAALERDGVPARPLRTTHAFHSRMLRPAAAELTAWVAEHITPRPPRLPYLSNVTGEIADAELVCDPGYWAEHMCRTVRFADGVRRLLADPESAIVEIGPGPSLGAMVRGADCPPERWPLITATLPAQSDPRPADAVLSECVSRLWLTGVDLDWAAYHGRGPATAAPHPGAPGRVPLPTYPFQRQRYWIEPAPLPGTGHAVTAAAPEAAADGIASFEDLDRVPRLPEERWLWQPVWRGTAAPAPDAAAPAHWLVYTAGPAGERVLTALRATAAAQGARVSAVRPGEGFTAGPDAADPAGTPDAADAAGGEYTVRPGDHGDAQAMLRDLRGRGLALERVVHLWTLDDGTGPAGPDGPDGRAGADTGAVPGDATDRAVALGLHTLVALAHAAGDLGLEGWSLDLVTRGAHPVLDGAEARPEAATLVGPALVVPLEYPGVTTRLLDVAPDTPAAAVVAELRRPRTDATVALRGSRRWVAGYEALPAPDAAEAERTVLREEGVYLITGGLGGIGLAMAERLARACRARLVLLGRRGLPPRERWAEIVSGAREADEAVRERVGRLLELVRLGAEVEVVAGDVAVAEDVGRAVAVARERFGALHGVLHAAGVPGTGLMQFKQPADSDLVLAPKVGGARALAEALRIGEADEAPLDFLALFSSITSATGGGPGQVDYCAANAYLDGFAASLAAGGRRAVSVAWGEWTWNAWDFGLAGYDDQLQDFFRRHRETFGIGFDEGWRSLLRALAAGEPQVVVSTQDLPTMVRYATGFTVEAVLDPAGGGGDGERHPRPELLTPFREPSGPAEEAIAEVWREQLKLERVGVLDNFFELGGNSLLGIALLAKLRKAFPEAELPPHVLYEAPTVEALARAVGGPAEPAPAGAAAAGPAGAAEQSRRRRSGLKTAAARRRRS